MGYTNEIQLFEIIQKESFESKKIDPIRKQAGLLLFDALSFCLGHSFEVYLP